MSRLGKQPITFPKGVEVEFKEGVITVKGPKGTLSRAINKVIGVTVEGGSIKIAPVKENDEAKAHWGTTAAHIHNLITGVNEGYTKVLELEGVGYRAEVRGKEIVLTIGFSHPVKLQIPEGVTVTVDKGIITLVGNDIEVVGQFAADVRAVRKPEPYKGKGIHYKGEYIIRKQGKKAV
jgi:large subunit ribosomal protein L6